MTLREYLITLILILAIAIGGYQWLSNLLLSSVETTLNNMP